MSSNGEKPDVRSENLDDGLLESLRDAYDPSALDFDLNERLIEAALSQTTSPSYDVESDAESIGTLEREQAARLTETLTGEGDHPLAELAEALRAAYLPKSITPTLADDLARVAIHHERRPNVVPIRLFSYAAAGLAIAAGIAIWVVQRPNPWPYSSATVTEQLVQSRSLAPLFAETFAQATSTQRIDRIYAVRSRELRHNRYASWRVR